MGRHKAYYRGYIPPQIFKAVSLLIVYSFEDLTDCDNIFKARVKKTIERVEPCERVRNIIIHDIIAHKGYFKSECVNYCGKDGYLYRKRTIIYEVARTLGLWE